MFKKVLIANRGEIAVRILRTLREMGVASVAVYSDDDRDSPHVDGSDEAYRLRGSTPSESYLASHQLLEVARRSGADAVIPGYGFLSENAAFARECAARNLVFVGPSPRAIEIMGLKPRARAEMQKAGVPVVPGGPANGLEEAKETARSVGYPIMLKAAAGGGGRGMRRVSAETELPQAWSAASSEAESSFADGTLYVEKVITEARHVEVQVLGDSHGNLVHLFERDCSMQRRHQKVIEECPSPHLPQAALTLLCDTAVRAARAVDYQSVGTFEFLVDRSHAFYFLEMNTRLQVEHPITELTTGFDLVREMLRVAAGEPLGYSQSEIERRGAAIECRVYAEDPARGFLPSPGTVDRIRPPEGPGIRHDSGVRDGFRMGLNYDAMLAKLCVWAPNREQAIARMRRALADYEVRGLQTNLSFLESVLHSESFTQGGYHTRWLETHGDELLAACEDRLDPSSVAALLVASKLANGRRAAPPERAQPISAWAMSHRRRRLGR